MGIDRNKLFRGYETVKEILISKGIMEKYSKNIFGVSYTEEEIMNDLANSNLVRETYNESKLNSKRDIKNFVIAIENTLNSRKELIQSMPKSLKTLMIDRSMKKFCFQSEFYNTIGREASLIALQENKSINKFNAKKIYSKIGSAFITINSTEETEWIKYSSKTSYPKIEVKRRFVSIFLKDKIEEIEVSKFQGNYLIEALKESKLLKLKNNNIKNGFEKIIIDPIFTIKKIKSKGLKIKTITWEKAVNMGFCEYGLYDFCQKLSIETDKKWNIIELQEKLNLSVQKDRIISQYKKELEIVGII